MDPALKQHLQTGATHLCRCWSITRSDGAWRGFTDHDAPITFEGKTFQAAAGLTARALEVTSGLSVDNSEAMGVLSHAALAEEDILAGRYDGARVEIWQLRWDAPSARRQIFVGHIGEITRSGGAFRAELRGLSDVLNVERPRVFQRPCAAEFGDARCGVDLDDPAYWAEVPILSVGADGALEFAPLPQYPERWFEDGLIRFLDGAGQGLSLPVRRDLTSETGNRRLEPWQGARFAVAAGQMVRLVAGCDRRFATCRDVFANAANFRGFPHLPGDDWLMVMPRRGGANSGGSMNS